ncbi:hypothetical protein COBT_000787 [Conglomerata obtusa]
MEKNDIKKLRVKAEKYMDVCNNCSTKEHISELLQSENYDELSEFFSGKLRLSTGGVRAMMKDGLSFMNEVTVNIIATTLASYFREIQHIISIYKRNEHEKNKIFIGFDGRYNSSYFAMVASKVFHELNFDVFITPRPVISPLVPFAVRYMEMDLGVMVTASHNSKEYNGLKIWLATGYQISDPYDKELEILLEDMNITKIDNDKKMFYLENTQEDYHSINIQELSFTKKYDFNDLIKKYTNSICNVWTYGKSECKGEITSKILFSSLCGPSKIFMEQCVINCDFKRQIEFFPSHCVIDPNFNGIVHPNPELHENYDELITFADQNNIEYIFLADPDGDRFGLAQKFNERWKIYDADEIAAIFAYFFVSVLGKDNLYFINTHYCNPLLEKIARDEGITYYKTETGFKNISKKIYEIRESVPDAKIFAYEDALGFLIGNGTEKDGVASAILMMKIIEHEEKIYKFLHLIYQIYGQIVTYKQRIRVENTSNTLVKLVECLIKNDISYDKNDKRIICNIGDDINFCIRASGTEEMIKIYANSSHKTYEELKKYVDDFFETNFKDLL